MILGIGTDIMDVARVREAIEKDPGFVYQIFTATEIEYCESKAIKYQHYTARFAAKEAFLKALGTGWQYGIRFTDIEIYHDQNGRPQISTNEKAKEIADNFRFSKILVSLAHIKDFATAIVVIEGEAKD